MYSGMFTVENVPEIDASSLIKKHFEEEYMKQGKIVIIKGMLENTPAFHWNLDYIEERLVSSQLQHSCL